MADDIGEDQIRMEEEGRDEASGCRYSVRLITTEVDPDADPVPPINGNGHGYGYGLLVHFKYHFFERDGLAWYDLHFSGQITSRRREALSPLLDLGGIPLAARNHIITLIFSLYGEMLSLVDPIQANVQVYAYDYIPPNHDVDVEEDIFLGLDEDELDALREDELDRVREMSAADFLAPTPASREAIQSLEKVSVAKIRETSCAVCLEGFPLGSEATRMPCSHAFHGDCIATWLHHRCFCPLCRFQMPPAP